MLSALIRKRKEFTEQVSEDSETYDHEKFSHFLLLAP